MYQNVQTCILEVNSTRMDIKLPMGLGAGKFYERLLLGFPQTCPKNFWTTFCANIFLSRTSFEMTFKKRGLHMILQTLGAIFFQIKSCWVPFLPRHNRGFHIFFPDFQRFCPVFTKSKLVVCLCPCLLPHTPLKLPADTVYCVRFSLPQVTHQTSNMHHSNKEHTNT